MSQHRPGYGAPPPVQGGGEFGPDGFAREPGYGPTPTPQAYAVESFRPPPRIPEPITRGAGAAVVFLMLSAMFAGCSGCACVGAYTMAHDARAPAKASPVQCH